MIDPIYLPFSPTSDVPAGRVVLAPLLLARFDSPEIELTWTTPGIATASFRARELPPEVEIPAGETLGTTIGKLAERAWLYEFTRVYPAASVSEWFTSYESDLVYSGHTCAAKRITHGSMRQGLALERDELTVTCDGLDVAPLLNAALLRLEVPLFLTVRKAEVSAFGVATAGVVVWTGEVASAKVRAKRITARAVSDGTVFDRKVPRCYLQPGCNHAVFSPGCGLDPAAWVHTAVMSNPGAVGWPFIFTLNTLSRAGGAALSAANAFAGGWLEAGAGSNLQRVPVLASSEAVGGGLDVTLSRDPSPWLAAGAAVRLYPGCDGKRTTCQTRYDNYLNFGGDPFVPTGNPSLIKLSEDAAGGKK